VDADAKPVPGTLEYLDDISDPDGNHPRHLLKLVAERQDAEQPVKRKRKTSEAAEDQRGAARALDAALDALQVLRTPVHARAARARTADAPPLQPLCTTMQQRLQQAEVKNGVLMREAAAAERENQRLRYQLQVCTNDRQFLLLQLQQLVALAERARDHARDQLGPLDQHAQHAQQRQTIPGRDDQPSEPVSPVFP